MDVIIRYWVGIMVENEDGPDGFGYTLVDKMTLFYAYYGLIDSTNPVWLQWVFDILLGLFEWFGIINNMENMVTHRHMKGVPVLSTNPCHHVCPISISGQDLEDLGSHPTPVYLLF